MENILITGSHGQVGQEIKEIVENKQMKGIDRFKFFFEDKKSLDITDKIKIKDFIENNKINIIINCAAYTHVDKAEEEPSLADQVNHQAVKDMAIVAKEKNIKLIHISTDYVFDGKHYKPYKESDKPNPINVYGKTKLLGEQAIQEIKPRAIIIRTSWLYSKYGKNFVKTILRLARERNKLRVVYDQIGTPTYAKDLAEVILKIVKDDLFDDEVKLYHYSNEGVCSWYDFAKAIVEISGLDCEIEPIKTEDYPTKAKRPYYCLMDKEKMRKGKDVNINHWGDTLDRLLNNIKWN